MGGKSYPSSRFMFPLFPEKAISSVGKGGTKQQDFQIEGVTKSHVTLIGGAESRPCSIPIYIHHHPQKITTPLHTIGNRTYKLHIIKPALKASISIPNFVSKYFTIKATLSPGLPTPMYHNVTQFNKAFQSSSIFKIFIKVLLY